MLFTIISMVDFLGMGISLWLSLYLLGRGFPGRITLRAAIVLVGFAIFFLGNYIALYKQVSEIFIIRTILFAVSFSIWNDLTHELLPKQDQRRDGWLVRVIYVFGFIIILLSLSMHGTFAGSVNVLLTARIGIQSPQIIYSLFQLFVSVSILYNIYVGIKFGEWRPNRYFLAASVLALITVGYSALSQVLSLSMPNLMQDSLLFSSMFAFGISIEHYQTRMEGHTTLEDFAISSLAVFWLSAIYTFIAWRIGFSPIAMILIAGLSILTHSSYNLIREFLERLRLKDENVFRHQLRQLESNIQEGMSLLEGLQGEVKLLCQALAASGAFIAIRDENQQIVVASHHSIPIGFNLSFMKQEWKDISPPPPEIENQVAWLVPAFQGGEVIALLGIGTPKGRPDYSKNNLNLLVETANHIAMMIYLRAHKMADKEWLRQIISDAQLYEANIHAKSDELIHSLITSPNPQFVKIVEEGLRNLSDFIALGQSSLPGYLGISITNQIERGKAVQQKLIQAIEILRPAQDCPPEPIPREWYSYRILHDAYQNQIPNHDIMSKLYISEGTFHRTRRAAVRAVAHALLEMRDLQRD